MRFVGRDFDGFRRAMDRQVEAFDGAVAADWLPIDLLEDHVRDPAGWDVALVVTDWLPDLIDAGAIQPLDAQLAAAPPPDWPHGWSPSMRGLQTDAEGRVWGMPYHDGPMMLLYRRDLFEDPSEQDRFAAEHGRALVPPRTWEEHREVARWFTRPEEGRYGTVMAGYPDAHNTVYDFLMQLWSRGGTLLDEHGQAAFDGPAGLAGLRYLRDLWLRDRVVDPAALELDSVASGRAFADGRAATTVNWSGFVAMSADPTSPTHGRVACAPVPRDDRPGAKSISMNVYWVTVVSAATRDLDEAYRFLAHLAGPDMDRITSEEGATGTRLSTWRDPGVRALSPYYSVIEEVHRTVQSPPQLRSFPRIAAVLDRLVHETISGHADPEEALARAGREVRDLR